MACILVLFTAQRDRQLLTQLLQAHHTITAPEHPFAHPLTALSAESDIDLVLIDILLLERVQPRLQSRLEQPQQLFPPVIALLPKPSLRTLPEALWNSLDEVLTLPIDPRELLNRVEVMLRNRQLAQRLNQANQKLETANQKLETANQQLQIQNDQLQEMNRLKSQFVSMVSHEFRNPLGVIYGLVQLMQRAGDRLSPTQQKDYLQRMVSTIQRLNGLVEDVMIMGRVGVGKLSLQPEPVDLTGFLKQVVQEIQFVQVEPREIELVLPELVSPSSVEIEGDSEGDRPLLLLDSTLLRHILTNLLSNALKYSPASAPVSLMLEQKSEQLTVTVADQGIGISPEDQAQLFEPFYRAGNVGEVKGTGLGLAIARQCAELHGGSLQLDSTLNQGTRVTLILPVTVAETVSN